VQALLQRGEVDPAIDWARSKNSGAMISTM
jgi:hypothetical protein